MKTELPEQFVRILFFLGATLISFLILMNADAVVNLSDGALSEWNGYVVAAHLLVVCGCGIAVAISRSASVGAIAAVMLPQADDSLSGSRWRSWRSGPLLLSAVLLAPPAVNSMSRVIFSSSHMESNAIGPLAFSVVGVASLPIAAISAALVIFQQWMQQCTHQEGRSASNDPTYLTSVTAGGAILGMAFYTLLVQPEAYFSEMLHFFWIGYVVLFMVPAIVLIFAWSRTTQTTSLVGAGQILSVSERTIARSIFLLGAVPSFLMVGSGPNVEAGLGSVAHAYVLPPTVMAAALAVAFARPPRVVQRIFTGQVALMSAIGILMFAISIYINRYAWLASTIQLFAVFGISGAFYMELATLRLGIGQISVFYLIASAGAFIGALLAEAGNLVFDRLILAFSLAAVLLWCMYRRNTVNKIRRQANDQPS